MNREPLLVIELSKSRDHHAVLLACVAGGMLGRASDGFGHSRSRLRYQNKSIRARNPASYAGYCTAYASVSSLVKFLIIYVRTDEMCSGHSRLKRVPSFVPKRLSSLFNGLNTVKT